MCRVILIVVVVSAVLVASCCGYDDEERWTCPDDTDCVEVLKCDTAIKTIRTEGSHSYKRCGWEGVVELVCCPTEVETTTSTTMSSTSSTTMSSSSSTSEIAVTRSTLRPSENACERYSNEVPLQLNFHILGGVDASRGEFPHMVALGYIRDVLSGEITWECAGSLISDRFVLTAAHCIARIRPVIMRLGILQLNDSGPSVQDHEITSFILHPQYVRRTGANDVALLQTGRSVEFNDMVHPACLYTQAAAPSTALLITGWGRIESGTAVRSVILQKARVRAFPIGPCNETYMQRLNRRLDDGQICAGSNDASTDTCQGDSGGPLQIFTRKNVYAIVGIVSFGLIDCGTDVPSVYTRVYHYLDWIEKNVWS